MPPIERLPTGLWIGLNQVAGWLAGLCLVLVIELAHCADQALPGGSGPGPFTAQKCDGGGGGQGQKGQEPKPVGTSGKLTVQQTFGGKMLDAVASGANGDELADAAQPSAAKDPGTQVEQPGGRGRRILWRQIQ